MQFMKKNLWQIFLIAFLIMMPIVSFARTETGNNPSNTQTGTGNQPSNTQVRLVNPLGADGPDTIPKFIRVLLDGALKIGMPVVALAIIYCGFLFVAARGNPEKLTKAKEAILYTMIGAAILLGSWAIAQLISSTITGLKAGIVN